MGAENDLERATSMARRMITHWGMSEKLGPVSYKMSDDDPFLGREMQKSRSFSEHTMEVIDQEVLRILTEAQQAANKLLIERKDDLQKITDGLLENEELDRYEIEDLIGPSVHGENPPRPGRNSNKPSRNGTASTELEDTSDESHQESGSETETASDQA